VAQALDDLAAAQVSVWLDDLSRARIRTGSLARMVDEGAITGVTTNSTIFAKAIGAGSGYEDQLRDLALRGTATGETVRLLMAWDVRAACDILHPAYERTPARLDAYHRDRSTYPGAGPPRCVSKAPIRRTTVTSFGASL
jgi:transaldolase